MEGKSVNNGVTFSRGSRAITQEKNCLVSLNALDDAAFEAADFKNTDGCNANIVILFVRKANNKTSLRCLAGRL